MKYKIGKIEYILYVVFDTIQLDLNVHNNVYIEEEEIINAVHKLIYLIYTD